MIFKEINFIIVLISFIFCFRSVMKEVKNRRVLKEKQMLLNIKITEDYMNIIDSIIQDSIIKYRALNIDHDPNFYMGTKEQNTMISEVLKDVLESMSPVFLEQSSLVYNREKLEDIIYSKISMAVLSVTVEINSTYKDV